MAVVQSQYINADRDVHLRDYRHAKNLFYEYGLAYAPKTKFLYHCLFEPSPEVGNTSSSNSFAFQKQIGVLVKSADLPSFRVSVENKKQYNRIKQFQTRIDYNDVNITFHDDNVGVTRALFEEYYKYYWIDGSHNVQKNARVSGPYASRDKYSESVPKYGMNTGNIGPFFSSITIYQLSRQQYFAYTLVNPIITQWNHGSVEASDGSGVNENTMSIAYEAVLYSNGDIGEDSEPVAFTDPETGYDQTPSPISEPALGGNQYISNSPKLVEPPKNTESQLPRKDSTGSINNKTFTTQSFSSFSQITTPKKDFQNQEVVIPTSEDKSIKNYEAGLIKRSLDITNPSSNGLIKGQDRVNARYTFVAKSINSGVLSGISDMKTFKSLYPTIKEQNIVIDSLIDRAVAGDQKLLRFATEAIGSYT